MSKNKKVFLIGYYDAGNLGDELLLEQCQGILVNFCNITLENIIYLSQQNTGTSSVYKKDYMNILKTIKNSDYIVFGGGSLFQSATSVVSLLYYSLLVIISKLLNKKVILFAQGIGEFNNKYTEYIARFIYFISDGVSVREGVQNIEFINNWGLTDKISQVSDLAWGLDAEINNSQENNNLFVNLRDYKTLTSEFIQNIAENINNNFTGEIIYLVAFQAGDKIILEKLKSYLLVPSAEIREINLYTIEDFHNNKYIFNDISQALCMRYHALLLNVLFNNKCLAINYDHKVSGLCEKLEINYLSLDTNNNINNSEYKIAKQEAMQEYKEKFNESIEFLKEKLQH